MEEKAFIQNEKRKALSRNYINQRYQDDESFNHKQREYAKNYYKAHKELMNQKRNERNKLNIDSYNIQKERQRERQKNLTDEQLEKRRKYQREYRARKKILET